MPDIHAGDNASNSIGENAQTGDINIRDTAAGNIYQGANADAIIQLLRERLSDDAQYRILDLKAREIRQSQLDTQLTIIKGELRIQRYILIIGLIIIAILLAIAF